MSQHEFTAEQIERSIALAIHDGELAVVPSLIRLLAVQDPHRAQSVLDTINLGLDLAREAQ